MITKTANARHFEAGNDDYHKRPEVSNSQLSVFLDDPQLFYRYFVTREWVREQTPDMRFGSEIHDILPPGCLSNVLRVIPPGVLNSQGHRKGAVWQQWSELNAGFVQCKADEIEEYTGIIRAATSHDRAMSMLLSKHVEYNIAWTDAETGIDCRVRLDRYEPGVCISDIKTTKATSKREFATDAWTMGYHRQAAFYQEGLFQLTGERLPFVFIACRKSRPYTVTTYELGQAFMDAGRESFRKALRGIAKCRASGKWEKDDAGQIIELSPPGWTRFESEWE